MFKEFRSKARGLPDLLPYACLWRPHLIINKDGSMTIIYRYAGPDLESASHEELAAQSARLNAALSVLGNGWMLNADTYRRAAAPYPEGERYFPDATSALIEEERRAQYNRQ